MTTTSHPTVTSAQRRAAFLPVTDPAPFPGRWIGGTAMLLGPLLLAAAAALRFRFDFFFPEQLAAYRYHPHLLAAGYGAFAIGCLVLVPAVLALAHRIGGGWALWGGGLTVLGLITRVFHAGIDQLAFQLVDAEGLAAATRIIEETYTASHVFKVGNAAIMLGWIVLAVGAWRTGVLGPVRSLALAAMSALPLGVLKGTTTLSIVAVLGLCVALLPLGLKVLRTGPRPRPGAVARWLLLVTAVLAAMVLLGEAG